MGEILSFLYLKPLCFWHSHPGMSKWPPMVDVCVLSDKNWIKLGVFWPYLVRTREMMGVGYSILTWLSLDISRLSPSPLVNLVMFSIPPWLISPARLHPKHRLGLLALSHSWTPVTWRKPWEIPWEKMWKTWISKSSKQSARPKLYNLKWWAINPSIHQLSKNKAQLVPLISPFEVHREPFHHAGHHVLSSGAHQLRHCRGDVVSLWSMLGIIERFTLYGFMDLNGWNMMISIVSNGELWIIWIPSWRFADMGNSGIRLDMLEYNGISWYIIVHEVVNLIFYMDSSENGDSVFSEFHISWWSTPEITKKVDDFQVWSLIFNLDYPIKIPLSTR